MKLKGNLIILIILVIFQIINTRRSHNKKGHNIINYDPFFQISYAVDKSRSYNLDSGNQFFDRGEVIDERLLITDDTIYTQIMQKFVEFSSRDPTHRKTIWTTDLTLLRMKIYTRDFAGPAKHEFLMVCSVDDDQREYYFVIDRGLNGTFDTKIRIVFTAEIEPENRPNGRQLCDTNSEEWAEKRGKRDDQPHPDSELRGDSNQFKTPDINKLSNLIGAAIEYGRRFRDYEIYGTNCQHFATGMWNAMVVESRAITNDSLAMRCNTRVSLDELFQRAKNSASIGKRRLRKLK